MLKLFWSVARRISIRFREDRHRWKATSRGIKLMKSHKCPTTPGHEDTTPLPSPPFLEDRLLRRRKLISLLGESPSAAMTTHLPSWSHLPSWRSAFCGRSNVVSSCVSDACSTCAWRNACAWWTSSWRSASWRNAC